MPARPDLALITATLRQNLPLLRERYGVTSLSLFGSYIRQEERGDSDLDVLVTFQQAPSLFRYVELENYLSDLLNIKVDLVMRDSLKPAIGRRILDEAVPV
jgi:predicted nucleotidyltransferase